MKKILRLLQWIIAIFIVMLAITGYSCGDYFLATFFLAFGIFLIATIYKKILRKNKDSNQIEQKTINQNDLEKSQNIDKMVIPSTKTKGNFKYDRHIIQRQGVQILETIYILATTKSINTLKGRFEFIENLYSSFIDASDNKRFISDIQNSIDEYKSTYYERIPNEYQIRLLIKPNLSNLKIFYADCILNCFNRFELEQKNQIEKLKRDDAKLRRKNAIIKTAQEAKLEMQKIVIDSNKIDQYIYKIENKINDYKRNIES